MPSGGNLPGELAHMEDGEPRKRSVLEEGSTIAVIGGGPAGAFFAIHFLRRARELRRKARVVILERRLDCPDAEVRRSRRRVNGLRLFRRRHFAPAERRAEKT